MTQPSLNQSFDTSLIDLSPSQPQDSFSTTESAPSDDYKPTHPSSTSAPPPLPTSTPKFAEAATTRGKMPTRYMPTVEAYDAWAEVYDTDGNILQAVDDYALSNGMLDRFITQVLETTADGRSIEIADLGCGTGRNTAALLLHPLLNKNKGVKITGMDASAGMLRKAAERLSATTKTSFALLQHDFLNPIDATLPPSLLPSKVAFDAVISTLVLEHFPLGTFFSVLQSLLRPNGIALVTNMHAAMGSSSQAGFVSVDGRSGEAIKVRGMSWVHGVAETVEAARRAGFVVVGEVEERGVSKGMMRDGVVGERGRKWVGVDVWYGMILRRGR